MVVEVVSSIQRGQKKRKIIHQISQERTKKLSAERCQESRVYCWDGKGGGLKDNYRGVLL